MRVSLLKNDSIKDLILPNKISGSYWLTDYDENGNEINLINIEATQEGWKLVSNDDIFCVIDNIKTPTITMQEYSFYTIKDKQQQKYFTIYCSPINEQSYTFYEIPSITNGLSIGNDSSNEIVFKSKEISQKHAKIYFNEEYSKLEIKVNDTQNNIQSSGVYVNNKKINNKCFLENDDIIFIMGLKVIVTKMNNKYICLVNNPHIYYVNNSASLVAINNLKQFNIMTYEDEYYEEENDIEMNIYEPNEYFHKKPRFVSKIEQLKLNVDAPPSKEKEPESSIILTIGPMLTMSMTSLVMGYTAINNVMNNNGSWSQATPSLVICGAMFASVFIWPFITKFYEKKRRKKNEKERQIKYTKYIEEKRQIIKDEVKKQSNILLEAFPSTLECQNIIKQRMDRLWERRIGDDDFLTVNLGLGNRTMEIDIKYPEEHFSMIEDNLKDIVTRLGSEPKNLENVPIDLSLEEYNILAFIGTKTNNVNLLSQLLLQIVTFHSYEDLKIVMLTNKENSSNWEFIKPLPHLFNNDKSIRYFGNTLEEYKEICYHLEKIYSSRIKNDDMQNFSKNNNKKYIPHYLIITDSFKQIRNIEVIKNILSQKEKVGFSIIILTDKVSTLPDQCQTFINTSFDKGDLFRSSLNNKNQNFYIINNNYDYKGCIKTLANIPIEIEKGKSNQLPDKISFLEMFDVGKIEQLNILNRWQQNNPQFSLQAPVGYGENGEKITLDLHEKYHGPHGLIAGMTGSGKSEFIITYILSMAINYHPYEVQFILIDYKGGGLAGAFENSVTGIKLPHLVGTITNLDANEIKRSLSSIESELKRRQRAFNIAREASGESTVDIYKYQKMYREGIIKEPVSHLFIICDEFAELKNQQPEFMEQLISTARIGRSLGVHLILATQKPSGVVDPQIWSNTRFRICLRVQEKSDSSEVIKCPDAAFLKQTGRFYFQVGFNEIFELGQAAWAGAKYTPSDKIKKSIDTSIKFINNIGYTIRTIETKKKTENENTISKGEELSNIIKYLAEISEQEKISSTPLWLEKIPAEIYIDNLIKKYSNTYFKEEHIINPIIGEYDVPNMQEQHILTLPVTKEGNALIYGMAGSGKENLITTLLYSSMIFYTPEELNYYILDFGAESLKIFNNAPIVGDVLTSIDDEKINNLFKKILTTIEERKKMFSTYNGNYQSYLENSGKSLPAIVVIINNYESFQETFPDCEDQLIALSRECSKYGVYFIMTVTTPNGVRFKLKQNFSQQFVLQQSSEDDYIAILGNVQKVYPSKLFGRGIIKPDQTYEFQTALIAQKDTIQKVIKTKIEEQTKNIKTKAPNIPILPEIVSVNDIVKELSNSKELIIGLSKENLNVVRYNYRKNPINIITALDIISIFTFIKPLINELIYFRSSVILINAEDFTLEEKYNNYITIINEKFDDIFEKLDELISKSYEQYAANNYNKKIFENKTNISIIINGLDAFKNKLNEHNRNNLKQIFDKISELTFINYIIIDSIDKIRKYEVESWYKNGVNTNEGIWIGNGINEQFSLKINYKSKSLREEISDDFCFVLTRGKPILTKLIEDFDIE